MHRTGVSYRWADPVDAVFYAPDHRQTSPSSNSCWEKGGSSSFQTCRNVELQRNRNDAFVCLKLMCSVSVILIVSPQHATRLMTMYTIPSHSVGPCPAGNSFFSMTSTSIVSKSALTCPFVCVLHNTVFEYCDSRHVWLNLHCYIMCCQCFTYFKYHLLFFKPHQL